MRLTYLLVLCLSWVAIGVVLGAWWADHHRRVVSRRNLARWRKRLPPIRNLPPIRSLPRVYSRATWARRTPPPSHILRTCVMWAVPERKVKVGER